MGEMSGCILVSRHWDFSLHGTLARCEDIDNLFFALILSSYSMNFNSSTGSRQKSSTCVIGRIR